MTDDTPYPDAPTPDELAEMEPSSADAVDDGVSQMADRDSWYNTAPNVAANLIVRVANEHDEFREHMLTADDMGAAHAMKEYDADAHETLNTMGLSALQGGTAEKKARLFLRDDESS